MKEEILKQLGMARKALSSIPVCDKQNCLNMGASLEIIDTVIAKITECNITPEPAKREQKEV